MTTSTQSAIVTNIFGSRYMETALFEAMLKETAAKAGVILKQISVSQQNADHPVLWTMDETSYLKFYLFQITTI